MIKFRTEKVIDVYEFDKLVTETYGKPYNFQQQDDCKDRGFEQFTVPCEADDYENDTIPEDVDHPEMGVSFKAWLERDPKQSLADDDDRYIVMWWERNFYPTLDMIVNDLYKKGLIEAGEYAINIDW